MSEEYGFARCSTVNQNEDRQVKALLDYGIKQDHIIIDKESGKKNIEDRTNYKILRALLRSGDTLVIDSIDRIGRRKDIIKAEIEFFKNKGVRLVVLSLPTTAIKVPEGQEWVIEMVTNILLEVYSSIAEQEVKEKERRTRAGIELAKAAGKYKGRKPIEYDHDKLVELYPRWKKGHIKTNEVLSLLGLKKNTFYRAINKYEEDLKKKNQAILR